MVVNISLVSMSRHLCHEYYKDFENDPDIYMDMSLYKPFQYSYDWANTYFDKQIKNKRLFFAIVNDGTPVGEVILKDINFHKGECTLSIHLKNNSVKGHGIGMRAEQLVLDYAFTKMEMNTVFADTILKNKRSQHVLEKVGFQFIRQDEMFRYYQFHSEDYEVFMGQGEIEK